MRLPFRLVILESPYAGDVEANLTYLRACMRDCLLKGDSPYASHGLLNQPGVLDDTKPEERALGIGAGFDWRARADATVVYVDRGISGGMKLGIEDAKRIGHPVEFRSLEFGNLTEEQALDLPRMKVNAELNDSPVEVEPSPPLKFSAMPGTWGDFPEE